MPAAIAERGTAPADWQFQPRWLAEAIEQAPQWKRRHGFPEAVAALLPRDDWHGVMTDFPERIYLILLQSAAERGGTLRGFAVHPGSWALAATEPVLVLDEGWHEVFPELSAEPALEDWRAEWLRWSQPHGLPAGEAEACRVQRSGLRVIVQAPARLAARYRTARARKPCGRKAGSWSAPAAAGRRRS